MSLKCCRHASLMLISRIVMPNASMSFVALLWVLSVVPNPGIVTPTIPFLSSLSLSNVIADASRARVESNPPEIPMTADFALVCFSRLANPAVCIEMISSQRLSSSFPCGTKGNWLNFRYRLRSLESKAQFLEIVSMRRMLSLANDALLSENVVFTLLSFLMLSTSI